MRFKDHTTFKSHVTHKPKRLRNEWKHGSIRLSRLVRKLKLKLKQSSLCFGRKEVAVAIKPKLCGSNKCALANATKQDKTRLNFS